MCLGRISRRHQRGHTDSEVVDVRGCNERRGNWIFGNEVIVERRKLETQVAAIADRREITGL